MKFDKSKFIAQYKVEAAEHVQKISDGLIRLEKEPGNRELLETMMREAHSIKGSSTMMGFKRVADIAHKMEDGLEGALKGEIELEKRHFDQLFKCLDAILPLLEDKMTWDDSGVAYPYVKELCDETERVFQSKSDEKAAPPVAGASGKDQVIVDQVRVAPVNVEAATSTAAVDVDSIRVDLNEIDMLVNFSGELLISKIRLKQVAKNMIDKVEAEKNNYLHLIPNTNDLGRVVSLIDLATSNIQLRLMNLRLLPVSYLFRQFPRAIRDLAVEKGKEVNFSITGDDTKLDKAILDDMKDPLMHLLRNAVDHGIEAPSVRSAKNKPACGQLSLSAYQRGSQVVIEVSDDGQGIDINAVKEKAVSRGIVAGDKIDEMGNEQIYQLLFMPGFSTKDEVTDISGRGVGLDVVRERVAKFKGMVEVAPNNGAGTKFIIKLPLTLAITESLLVSAGTEEFAIPIDTVIETLRISNSDIRTIESKEVVTVRNHIIPLVRLTDIFSIPSKGISERRFNSIVVVQSVEKRLAILVDTIIGRQEIVSKSLGSPLKKVKNIAGATILGSGKIVLLLDVPSILDSAEGVIIKRPRLDVAPPVKTKKRKTILLAEDTLSTATLEKNILESVGYSVVIARDGAEALDRASHERFDLVITDILMPRLDGFGLIEHLRKDKIYKDIPIIVVTTRESDVEKKRGLDLGADAYLLKSEFTSEGLLDTIERLLG